jgi:hypothetical protein
VTSIPFVVVHRFSEIFKGAVANDKTGTPARQAADIINGNFTILDNKITALQSPDGVFKSGAVVITGLNGAIAATALHGEWVVFLIYRLLLLISL